MKISNLPLKKKAAWKTQKTKTMPPPHIGCKYRKLIETARHRKKSIYIHHYLSAGRMYLPCDGIMQNQTKAVIRRFAKTNGKRENAI